MKTFAIFLSAFFSFSVSFSQNKPSENPAGNHIERIINSQWTFNYMVGSDSDKGYESPDFDDSKWIAISLPHSWNTYETTGELPKEPSNSSLTDNLYWITGWGWYRKHFSVNKAYSGEKCFIEFEGIHRYCRIWLNGKFIGEHRGDGSFDIDITSGLKYGDDNVLAVATNIMTDSEVNTNLKAKETDNLYGGINRNVKLVLRDKLFIPMTGSSGDDRGIIITSAPVSEKERNIRIQTWVKNDYQQNKICTLITSLTDQEGKLIQTIKSEVPINAGQSYKFDQTGKPVKNPHLWTSANPYIYHIDSKVIDGRTITDVISQPFGFDMDEAEYSKSKELAGVELIRDVLNRATKSNDIINNTADLQASRIVLTGSGSKIVADRGSVVTIKADLVDNKGNQIRSTGKTLKWVLSGPATLVGPAISEPNQNLPVINVVRSVGKPGKIHLAVVSSGLISGSLDIEAKETIPDNSIISEPILKDEGRIPVARMILNVNRLDELPIEINPVSEDIVLGNSDRRGYKNLICAYIFKFNQRVDTASIECRALINLFSFQLVNAGGRLTADDYNYNTDHFNNCRLIYSYIDATKLPVPFKDGLRNYYSDLIIIKGSEKNAGEEMNWLNWIPSGGNVVMVPDEKMSSVPKGVIAAKSTELGNLIATVYPQFVNFSEEAKERALLFTSKMNPYVYQASSQTPDRIIYLALKGQPILIPLVKFISE